MQEPLSWQPHYKSRRGEGHFSFNTSLSIDFIKDQPSSGELSWSWVTGYLSSVQFSSVAESCLTLCNPMDWSTPGFPVPSPNPRACSNSCPSNWWCHPTISSSVVPFSFCLQPFPASGSLLISKFLKSGSQSIGVSASASVLSMNILDWFPLGWTGWISLLSKGLSRVFSNTTVQRHQSFSAQLSLWSNRHIHTWLLEKP